MNAVIGGLIFAFACYILVRVFKTYQKSFISTITVLTVIGTICGVIMNGF